MLPKRRRTRLGLAECLGGLLSLLEIDDSPYVSNGLGTILANGHVSWVLLGVSTQSESLISFTLSVGGLCPQKVGDKTYGICSIFLPIKVC